MKELNETRREGLSALFGKQVTFDGRERKLYAHDAGMLPPPARTVPIQMPAAVVQPTNADQLVELVQWAVTEKIPLTPRGRATSSYGGAVPTRGGIVVDFSQMRRILAINPDGNGYTVTVEPGITWQQLNAELAEIGLETRLYPSSAPASTVGGWLAQGGAGIGSFEYGYFAENVISANVVQPDGTLRTFQGKDLELIADAEGITGLIASIELRVRLASETLVQAYRFNSAAELREALQALITANLPLWSITFINPTMARFQNQLPDDAPRAAGERPALSHAYLALLAYPAARRAEIDPVLPYLLEPLGKRLGTDIAAYEWGERFHPVRIKRLGPSFVPARVIVPLDQLDSVLHALTLRIEQPLAIQGTLVKGGEVALTGYIPNDERTLAYRLAYALAFTILNTAKEYGGRAYGTGMYYAHEREAVLGKARVEALESFKRTWDAHSLMNPDKVLSNTPVHFAFALGNVGERLARPFANQAVVPTGEHPQAARKLHARTVWNTYACAQCGCCLDTCAGYLESGWESASPRGKYFILREYLNGRQALDPQTVDTLLNCTRCDVCTAECQLGLEIDPYWGLRPVSGFPAAE